MAGDKKYTKTELTKKTVAELQGLLDDNGFELEDDWKKADLIEVLLGIEESPEDEEEDDEEDDEAPAAEVDDEEDDEEEDDLELPDEDEIDEVDDIEEAPAAEKKTRAKKPKVDSDGKETLAAKQVATILETEAKTLRQFFRSSSSTIEAVGSGGRYEFLESDVPQIVKEFTAWRAAHAGRGTKRTEGGTKRDAKAAVEVIEVEELEIEEEEDLELED